MLSWLKLCFQMIEHLTNVLREFLSETRWTLIDQMSYEITIFFFFLKSYCQELHHFIFKHLWIFGDCFYPFFSPYNILFLNFHGLYIMYKLSLFSLTKKFRNTRYYSKLQFVKSNRIGCMLGASLQYPLSYLSMGENSI